MPKIIFKNKGVACEAEAGISILDAALDFKVPIYHTCGGNASCSTCRVIILKGQENISSPDDVELQVLDAFDLEDPYRLGCQTHILQGEVEVEIPDRTRAPRANKTPPIPS